MRKPVEIVKVKEFIPIYKDGEPANNIEAVRFEYSNGDECGFVVIAQKGLHTINENSIYIAPDYCLPNESKLFESFTAPDGNPKKSKLGKENRIRAIKFNFGYSPESNGPIYSNGILLPYDEVYKFIFPGPKATDLENIDLVETLSITKYEEPVKMGGHAIGGFPSYLYKTDETNILSMVSDIKKYIDGETVFGISLKHDGSSATYTFTKNGEQFEISAYSRKLKQNLESKKTVGYKNETEEFHKYFDKKTKTLMWRGKLTQTLISDDDAKTTLEAIEQDDPSPWVKLAEDVDLFEKGLQFCVDNNVQLAFRGEMYGKGYSKGSGNKHNFDSTQPGSICFFGIDVIDDDLTHTTRQHYGDKYNLKDVCEELNLEYTKVYEYTPKTYEDLIQYCDKIINDYMIKHNRIIEGLVIRTMYSNDISCKYMNEHYDSLK